MKKIFTSLVLFLLLQNAWTESDSYFNDTDSPVQVGFEFDSGLLGVLFHTVQFGDSGTVFNYKLNGGQEILFPIQRFQAGMTLFDQHRIKLLYQPLEVNTQVVFRDNVTIDGVLFPSGTAVDVKYGFPFYRLTYNFDFFPQGDLDAGVGAALQIRDASISFTSVDGSLRTVNQNVGPVPALNLYFRQVYFDNLAVSADITGLYASSAFINGASFNFEGSILDANLKTAWILDKGMEAFLNIRFLGGTAAGVSSYPDIYWTQGREDYTANFLSTFIITAGVSVK